MELILYFGILVVLGFIGGSLDKKKFASLRAEERVVYLAQRAKLSERAKRYDTIIFGGIVSTGMLLLFVCMIADTFFRGM